MRAFKFILAGGAGIAALAVSAPASAQYYPGYGGYSPYGGNVVGQVLGQIFGGYGANGYGVDSRALVDRCAAAVTDRINRQYGGYAGYNQGYGGYGGYNQGYAGGARVVQITSVERKSNNKLRVRGIAQTSMGGGYGGYAGGELAFKCNVDYRGYISDIDLYRTDSRYGYGNSGYSPYGSYRRY